MPAVLNEGAFVDNRQDIADWNEDAELKRLAIAYGMAAVEFLELEKKNTVTLPLPVLSYGSKGETVKAVQDLLKGAGYKVGATGKFGAGTQSILENAQLAWQIPVTGKTDGETWKALLGIK
jgi:peptidoglycan hydrolase-like protein with peptidoglycan-binding domain